MIGALAATAQSAKRGTPHNEQNRKTSETKASRSQGNDLRDVDNNAVRPNVSTTSTQQKTTVNKGNSAQRSTAPAPQNGSRVQNDTRKTSTTNHHNPKSDYRAPNTTVNAGKTYLDPKQRTTTVVHKPAPVVKHHQTGYVSKRYYPTKRVRIHVHPVTYHHHYRALYYPAHREIIWTNRMHRYYVGLYPNYTYRYPVGYHIQTISAFEARYNVGEVARIYGRVYATWYNRETDDLLLFFGGEFPYQEFTMVVPGSIARRFNWRPERYFLGQHVFATGLITSFEGKPELIVKQRSQLDVY